MTKDEELCPECGDLLMTFCPDCHYRSVQFDLELEVKALRVRNETLRKKFRFYVIMFIIMSFGWLSALIWWIGGG